MNELINQELFDTVKLNSLNAEHLRKKSNEEILGLLRAGRNTRQNIGVRIIPDEFLLLIIEAMKERVTFIHEFMDSCKYFYEPPKEYEQKAVEKNWKPETPEQLKKLSDAFSSFINPTK